VRRTLLILRKGEIGGQFGPGSWGNRGSVRMQGPRKKHSSYRWGPELKRAKQLAGRVEASGGKQEGLVVKGDHEKGGASLFLTG